MPAWPLAVLVLALVCSGCGGEAASRGRADMPDALLLSYEAGNHLHRYGGRVFADGRYELYSTADQVSEPNWTVREPFTPAQIDEIRAAVDAALAAGLPDRVPADGPPPPDADTARFVLRDRAIVVEDWSGAPPPELQGLVDRIAQLRRPPPAPSTWRLWSRGAPVELEARCEIGEVVALDHLRDAIFMPAARPTSGASATSDPPAGTPLVRITFTTPKGDERLEVYPDGRRIDLAPGGDERVHELDADRMAAIRQALAETDWAALPARLC
jgi:hypothetical protein